MQKNEVMINKIILNYTGVYEIVYINKIKGNSPLRP